MVKTDEKEKDDSDSSEGVMGGRLSLVGEEDRWDGHFFLKSDGRKPSRWPVLINKISQKSDVSPRVNFAMLVNPKQNSSPFIVPTCDSTCRAPCFEISACNGYFFENCTLPNDNVFHIFSLCLCFLASLNN